MSAKSPNESKAQMTVVMLPSDANPQGNVFGGVILKNIDLIAAVVAKRHTRTNIVTASIDKVNFLKPVLVGNALILTARLNYVGRSSMEIEVKVEAEDLEKGDRIPTGTAFVTAVALDENSRPTEVPRLLAETEEDKRRFSEGEARMAQRVKELGKVKT
ncbi:MAG: acyl-CoA thioesterase [Nitrososphaerales archaeon]